MDGGRGGMGWLVGKGGGEGFISSFGCFGGGRDDMWWGENGKGGASGNESGGECM